MRLLETILDAEILLHPALLKPPRSAPKHAGYGLQPQSNWKGNPQDEEELLLSLGGCSTLGQDSQEGAS